MIIGLCSPLLLVDKPAPGGGPLHSGREIGTLRELHWRLLVVPPQEVAATCCGGQIACAGGIAGAAAVRPVKSASGCRRLVSGKKTRRPAKWDSYAAIIISSAVVAPCALAGGGRRSATDRSRSRIKCWWA